MSDNDIEIDAVFCLKCGQGFITKVEYEVKTVECPSCLNKHKVRFYKNGKVAVRNEG